MIQGSRDADHALCGLRLNRTAGRVQDGCRLFGAVRPAGARPCRGLQDRGTQCRGAAVPSFPGEDHCGRREELVGPYQISHWSSGDSLAAAAGWAATFGDGRRQLLGVQMPVGSRVRQGWRGPVLFDDPSEDTHEKRLMTSSHQTAAGATHTRSLMRSGFSGGKVSGNTTKNDTIQDSPDLQAFLKRSAMLTAALTDRVMAGRAETAPEGSRSTKHELGEGPGMDRRAIACFRMVIGPYGQECSTKQRR